MSESAEESLADPFQLCGSTIEGKYRIASVVGDGGFGVVYRGVHQGFGELIAVKCLKLPHVLNDKQRDGFLEQLREEGRLLHRLSKATPGIVQALDVGAMVSPSGVWVPYLVLEWLEGETLADHLAKRFAQGPGGYPLAEAVRLLEPAARALAVAHGLKVAHRDVKPHNLFVVQVAGVQTLKVLDFGIAKVLTDYSSFTEALAMTRAAPTAFTPRYGAPEQFNKQRGATGPWTDVFALALILVEVMSGRKALVGDDPTQLYIASADPNVRPTPRSLGLEVPDEFERVVEKALSVDPKFRFPEAGEFWDALVAAARIEPLRRPSDPARQAPTVGRGAAPVEPTVPFESSRTERLPVAPAFLRGGEGNGASASSRPPARPSDASPKASLPSGAESMGGTKVSPGSAKAAAYDPMSETPFFERHMLPKSVASPPQKREMLAPGATRNLQHIGVPPPKRTKPSEGTPLWPFLLGAVLAGGGAVAYMFYGDLALPPKTAPTAVVSAKPPLHKPAPVSGRGPAQSPSAKSSAASDASTTPSASADPFVAPPEMVLLGAGSRTAKLARAFYLDRTEVTVRAYQACASKGACPAAERVSDPIPLANDAGDPAVDPVAYVDLWSRRCNASHAAPDHPVNCVDYAAAEAFCKWSQKRLPTDVEWEFAARGVEGRTYPWGNDAPQCGRACYDKNEGCRTAGESVATCPAGLHPADRTPEGVFDLGANLSEWVKDGSANPGLRALRGASFFDGPERLRGDYRIEIPSTTAHPTIGFRCALDAPTSP